jgi:hypothetical protein
MMPLSRARRANAFRPAAPGRAHPFADVRSLITRPPLSVPKILERSSAGRRAAVSLLSPPSTAIPTPPSEIASAHPGDRLGGLRAGLVPRRAPSMASSDHLSLI